MKNTLVILLLYISLSVSGATYYLSPSGNDSNPGNLSQPFFSLNKAWTVVSAGDIVYMRGGTYEYTSTQNLSRKNGNSGNELKIFAYPGETPIIKRGSGFSYSGDYNPIVRFSGNYVHWKGLEITGNTQTKGSAIYTGMVAYASNNCIFELLNIHHNGMGFWLKDAISGADSDNNLFLNCDFHHNMDPLTTGDPYGNADGIGININIGNTVTLRGCRMYYNSDDGIDPFGSDATIIIDKCWAFYNGLQFDTFKFISPANGFKLGGTNSDHGNTVLFHVTNCLAYRNSWIGYNQNQSSAAIEAYNNISSLNGVDNSEGKGFQFNDPPGIVHILKNNISYNDYDKNTISSVSRVTNNTFLINGNSNPAYSLSSADFISTDPSGLTSQRQSDGSLPDINFFKLVQGSDLIDKGADVGLAYSGSAPDIGAFEFQAGSPSPLPVIVNSVVENATPAIIVITYDLILANIVPSSSAFSVMINSAARTINAVSISGKNVLLNLSSPVVSGDIVTVSYTKPTTNPLQTPAGTKAASISKIPVKNNCIDPTKPNEPPVVMINYKTDFFSGFIGELDATGTYDINNDILIYEWTVPENVSVSSTNASKIEFLAPIVLVSQSIAFQLDVRDGTSTTSKLIQINIMPYKPELDLAKITNIDASEFQALDYPKNASDGHYATKWSVTGDNQWLVFQLDGAYKISHLEITFLKGQEYTSYFDIFGSNDNLTWEPILINSASCNFSGDAQVYDFPEMKKELEYSYLKLIGHGNSLNSINDISEFKVFGLNQENPATEYTKEKHFILYPNPAREFFNISIEDPVIEYDLIVLIDLSGKIVFKDYFKAGINMVQIPAYLKAGIYIVELMSVNLILYTQYLIVKK